MIVIAFTTSCQTPFTGIQSAHKNLHLPADDITAQTAVCDQSASDPALHVDCIHLLFA